MSSNLYYYTDRELRDELERRQEARKKGLCDFCGKKASSPPCDQPDRHVDRTKCRVCHAEDVPPDSGLVCSATCAFKLPLPELEVGRIEFKKRPRTGETWINVVGYEVVITTVDPSGRSFDYVRFENEQRKFGSIGQSEILDGRVRKIKDAP